MQTAVLVLGIAGLVFGGFLAFAARKFKVEVDPKVAQITEILPGANCGGCGYPGCSGFAAAVVEGKAPITACSVGGSAVAEKIAEITGLTAEAVESKVAVVYCQGGDEFAQKTAEYYGLQDCRALNAIGGVKECPYGCLGLGSCVSVCKFGAIYMGPDNIPVVDKDKCTGCGACAKICPRNIIELVPKSKEVHIRCRSYDKGPVVRKYCKVGCIACSLCVRSCPQKAIAMDEGTLAKIDYALCDNCGICVGKCPAKTIIDDRKESVKAAS